MKKIIELKPGDIIVSDDYGWGEVENIGYGKINVFFTDMTDQTYITCCENLQWYQENCYLPDENEAQIFWEHIRQRNELLLELEEYIDPYCTDECSWEDNIKVGDHFLNDKSGFGEILEICGDKYLVEFTDMNNPNQSSTVLETIDWFIENCKYLSKAKSQPFLNLIRAYNNSTDYVCGAEDYYDLDQASTNI